MKALYISEDTHAKLKEWSIRTGIDMTDCANEAIDMWIYRKKNPIQFGPDVIRAHDWPHVFKR